jgi:hypothetical protein
MFLAREGDQVLWPVVILYAVAVVNVPRGASHHDAVLVFLDVLAAGDPPAKAYVTVIVVVTRRLPSRDWFIGPE